MESKVESIVLEEIDSNVKEKNNKPLVARDVGLVGHVDVEVSVNIGHANVSLSELFSLRSGEVLTLKETVDSPVTLLVSGKPVARGNLVAVDDYFGVEIIEING